MELYIGKEIWLKPTYYGAQIGYKTTTGVVSKIGRKYVDIVYGDKWAKKLRFDMTDNLREKNDYNTMWVVYESEQAILDEIEHAELESKCSKFFKDWSHKKLSTSQYRRIVQILEETETTANFNESMGR